MKGRGLINSPISAAAGCAAVMVVAFGLFAADARAALIEGTIGFGGQWQPLDAGGNVTSIQNATQVDIVNDQAVVTAATGDYAAFLFQLADYNDFSFAPFTPATPLWTVPKGVGTFSFDLLTASIDSQTANTLSLVGTGVLRGIGFDNTPGRFTFSGDGNGGTFTFSNSASTIPEPQTLALFGIGLIGLGFFWRRKARAPMAGS